MNVILGLIHAWIVLWRRTCVVYRKIVLKNSYLQPKVLFGVDPLYKGGYRKKEQQSTLTFAFTVFWLYLGFLSVPVHPSIGQTLVATLFLGFLTVD